MPNGPDDEVLDQDELDEMTDEEFAEWFGDDSLELEPDLGISDDNWACGTLDVDT